MFCSVPPSRTRLFCVFNLISLWEENGSLYSADKPVTPGACILRNRRCLKMTFSGLEKNMSDEPRQNTTTVKKILITVRWWEWMQLAVSVSHTWSFPFQTLLNQLSMARCVNYSKPSVASVLVNHSKGGVAFVYICLTAFVAAFVLIGLSKGGVHIVYLSHS